MTKLCVSARLRVCLLHAAFASYFESALVSVQDMKRHGLVTEEQIQEAHKQSVIQMQHIQDAARHPNVKAPTSSGN